jgi:hypothetical protein
MQLSLSTWLLLAAVAAAEAMARRMLGAVAAVQADT